MTRTSYQLMKNNEPIALGSMTHCLDVFYWEIYYGYDHLAYNIVPFRQDEEVYRKAKAFDAIVDIEDDFVKYHGFSPCVEEYTEEVEDIISEYLEDK